MVGIFIISVGTLCLFYLQTQTVSHEELVVADGNETEVFSEPAIGDSAEVRETQVVAPTPEAITEALRVDTEAMTSTERPVIDSGKREVITLAGGCFWCTEAYLQETPGVVSAISGYAGGDEQTANYKAVSRGSTAHREAVQVTFDPARISIGEILAVYWSHINPTDAGGQFADRGSHYTTAIYYHTNAQREVAESSKQALEDSQLFSAPIATVIEPYTTFFAAEEYHQDYYKKAAEHYERYKKGSGRAGFVEENWAKAAALEFLDSQ